MISKVGNRTKDITGIKFGSLTALSFSHTGNRQAYWNYSCVCGGTVVLRANTISYQAKKHKIKPQFPSCGCMELAQKTKHGFRKLKDTHPAYRSYRGIMTRCYDKNDTNYKWYGAVGVTICDEWKDNPESFVKWSIENGWSKGLHIDKDILCDAQGIHPHVYSPQTCQWVTAKVNVGYATNRNNFGKHPNVKLSQESVDEILHLYNSGKITNQSELARMFGVQSPSSIGRLVRLDKEAA